MSIKNLANNLKTGQATVTSQPKKKTKQSKNDVPEFFKILKTEINDKKIDDKVITYIDKDIIEVLSLIKTRCKIPMSTLLTHIVEEWIKEHKSEIKKLPTNKYL